MESGVVGGPPSPIDADDLARRDPGDPAVLDLLISYEAGAEDVGVDLRKPRGPLLESVASASAGNADWGLALATALYDRQEWGSDLWDSLAESWSQGHLTDTQWARALDLLLAHGDRKRHARAFARLLEDAVRSSPSLIPLPLLPVAETVATALWQELVETSPDGSLASVDDWLERAINEPAGQLATFFLHSLSAARSAGAEQGIGGERWVLLESMLTGESYSDGLARAVLASQTHFLHSVDREWTVEMLLPIMIWGHNPIKARQAWDGFLSWGRLNPTLVDDLLPMYESLFPHLSAFDRLRDRFSEHLSIVAFLSGVGPVSEGWLLRFVREADGKDVEAWTQFVTHQLRSMSDEGRERAWAGWIDPYWRLRIAGNPRAISDEEAKGMAEWPLHLPTLFEDAVDRVCSGPAAGADGLIFYSLEQTDLPERYPAAVTRLAGHVLTGQSRPFWHCDHALGVGHRVAAAPSVPREDIQGLVDQLLRLHCQGAEGILGSSEASPLD
jgi:hypothetical protein